MISRTRLRRGATVGTVAAISLGLASLAPQPTSGEANCPTLAATAETPATYATEADKRAANFGAFMLGYLVEKCEAHERSERVLVDEQTPGEVTLTLQRRPNGQKEGEETGHYQLSITAKQSPDGLSAADITTYNVTEIAIGPDRIAGARFVLNASDVETGWIMYSHQPDGVTVQGNTGASLSEQYTEQLLDSATEVIDRSRAGEPI